MLDESFKRKKYSESRSSNRTNKKTYVKHMENEDVNENTNDIINGSENKGVKISEKHFDEIWNLYPNRQGKKNALRHFLSTVKTEQDITFIKTALCKYLDSHNVKKGFIKNGSTWFNEWQDWIEPTTQMMEGANGKDTRPINPNSPTGRATFHHDEDAKQRLRNLQATLEQRDRDRIEHP
jgi:hypothetical protein